MEYIVANTAVLNVRYLFSSCIFVKGKIEDKGSSQIFRPFVPLEVKV